METRDFVVFQNTPDLVFDRGQDPAARTGSNIQLPMLPALIVIQWIPLLSRREPGIPKSRLIHIFVAGLTVLLILGTTVF